MIAQKLGVSMPEEAEGASDDARKDAKLREALLKVHEVAAAYYREQLAGPAGSPGAAAARTTGASAPRPSNSSASGSPRPRATA